MAILVALGGAFLGWILVFLGYLTGYPAWSDAQKDFVHNENFLVWLVVILAQAAFWPIIAFLSYDLIRMLRRKAYLGLGAVKVLKIVVSAVLFLGLGGVITYLAVIQLDRPEWLPGYEWKVTVLSVAGIMVALPAAIGIWLIDGPLTRLLTMSDEEWPAGSVLDRVKQLERLQQALRRFLSFLGVLLTGALLGAAAERKAVVAFGEEFNQEVSFPTEYILLYGLLFSALIAVIYAPTHITLVAAGKRTRDRIFPMLSPDDENWADRIGQRKTFDELLDLGTGTGATLKASVAVLSPLLAAISTLLLKFD